nr:MAG TPA: hypothetical protein [Caudoviricetes sp.]
MLISSIISWACQLGSIQYISFHKYSAWQCLYLEYRRDLRRMQ